MRMHIPHILNSIGADYEALPPANDDYQRFNVLVNGKVAFYLLAMGDDFDFGNPTDDPAIIEYLSAVVGLVGVKPEFRPERLPVRQWDGVTPLSETVFQDARGWHKELRYWTSKVNEAKAGLPQ